MSGNDGCCPPSIDVQDFQFKEDSIGKICEEFLSVPVASSLIAADGKRGLLYIGHENKLIVVKPGSGSIPQWRLDLDLPAKACRVELNCDFSYLAVTFSQPIAAIYDAASITKHKLDKLHEIRLSLSVGDINVLDFKWNPAIPDVLCSITSNFTIGCFQVSRDKGVTVIGKEKPANLDAMCVSWSPKGKQLVVGCRNGDIVQLKPELKIARHLTGPDPSEGVVVSILWVSNYQFCACYFKASEERISVMIVDAPKGVTAPKFTNYEDITYGAGPRDNIRYYFEYITEWGIIVAASTHSSELAILGTADNGATWNQWQLMEGCTVQLPLDRKKGAENYPVGIAIDKSITQKLPWGPDTTLPNPLPILRILVTSGQMCCYHMVNLKNNVPVLCSPPTETIPAPALSRPSLGPAEVSFNLPVGATSTPQKGFAPPQMQPERAKTTNNMFSDVAGTNLSFSGLANKFTPEPVIQNPAKSSDFSVPVETKITGLFGQGDGKNNFFQQTNTVNKQQPTLAVSQSAQPAKPAMTNIQQQSNVQQNVGLSAKQPIIKADIKIPSAPTTAQAEPKLQTKSPPKQTPVYDDGICLQAFREEQARFEAELKAKLELPSWDCGTEEERQMLVTKTYEVEEFFKELQETTTSLETDVSYLKALLLQSFAWLEETKSKSSSNTSLTRRSRSECNKLAELRHFYEYTQMQLIQATKVLDSELTDHKNRELSKLKLPTTEMIYQSLLKQGQIIAQEKKTIEELSKKWRNITRGRSGGGGSSAVGGLASLDRSMASLNLSQTSNAMLNDTAIELRCKLIAATSRKFNREKEVKLRDLLAVTEPKVISAVKPTAVQDRLQATLSSLASLKAMEASSKAKPQHVPKSNHTISSLVDSTTTTTTTTKGAKPAANPLSSLDNLVFGLGGTGAPSGLSKSPSSPMPFAAMSTKPATFTSPSQKSSAPSVPSSVASQQPAGITKNFSFSISGPQKASEPQASKESAAAASTKFPSFSFVKPDDASQAITPTVSTAATNPMNFASLLPKTGNPLSVNFSAKSSAPNFSTSQPSAVAPNLSNLNFGARPTSTATTTTTTITAATSGSTAFSSTFSFGNLSVSPISAPKQPQMSTNDQVTTSTSISVPGQSGTGQLSFGNISLSIASPTITSQEKPAVVNAQASTTAATTMPNFNAGSNATLGSVTSTAQPSPLSTSTQPTTAMTTATAASATSDSSTLSLAGLLGATSSLNFDSATSVTASTGSPAFGNVFGSSSLATKTSSEDSSNTAATATNSTPSSPFGSGASVTATTSTTSIFGDASKTTMPSLFGGQTAVSSSSGNSFFNTKLATTTSSSIFGAVSSTPSSTSMFGGGTVSNASFAASPTTTSSNVFGANSATQAGTSIFGGGTKTTQDSGTSVFGASATPNTSGSLFGGNTAPSTTSSVFGFSGTPSSSSGSVFGASATPSSSVFGGVTAAAQGNSIFGAASTIASPFGAKPATAVTTAASSSIFGSGQTASPFGTSGSSVFGGGATSTSSMFGGAAATASSPFGSSATSTTAASVFGSSAATTTTPSLFGASATTAATSVFGTPTATTAFGAASPQATGGSMFGSAAPTSPTSGTSVFGGAPALGGGTSMFGGASSAGSMFGQSAAFGAKPAFGAPATGFGAAAGFGSSPTFGGAPTPVTGFGSQPTFGAVPPAASTSPGKVFGSNTFETLGSQSGGLSFGSLAQSTTEQKKPQAFQGSSSFTSWR